MEESPKKKVLEPPFFRMHLRSSAKSDQHKLLLELEKAGNEVYYAAPEFTSAMDLNEAYVAKEMIQRTVFISPVDIGPLPDKKEHWLAFKAKQPVAYFLSKKPRRLPVGTVIDGGSFLARLADKKRSAHITEENFERIRETMLEVVLATIRQRRKNSRRARGRRDQTSVRAEARLIDQFERLREGTIPHRAVGYLAMTFFGAEALYVKHIT